MLWENMEYFIRREGDVKKKIDRYIWVGFLDYSRQQYELVIVYLDQVFFFDEGNDFISKLLVDLLVGFLIVVVVGGILCKVVEVWLDGFVVVIFVVEFNLFLSQKNWEQAVFFEILVYCFVFLFVFDILARLVNLYFFEGLVQGV